MSLVRFSAVGKEYGARWVLRDVSFTVSAGERWGVVGRNGYGKTTLLRLLTGEETPSEGSIWRHPGLRLRSCGRTAARREESTIGEAALAPFRELLEMERRMQREAEELRHVDTESEAGQRLLHSYDRNQERFRRAGGYEVHARAEAALEGLGFPAGEWSRTTRSLSGGELGRLRLAQTLLEEPELLLLDEPTNHLDLRATEWLEAYLRGYRGTVMMVSHDRVFLDRLADRVLHVEEGTAHAYSGGYESFLEQRAERRELQRKEHERQQAMIARTEDFIRRNLAGQKTKQAKSRRTLLAHLERVDAVQAEERAMAVRFSGARRSGGSVLRLDSLAGGYAGKTLFSGFSAEVGRGERIAIVGRNGSGKTTLMRILAGAAEPLSGELIRGTGVRVGYYRQDFSHLDPARTVWQEVSAAAPRLGMPELRAHLGRFLFSGDEVEARVGDLSGGEQARVALAGITLHGANLLLLDEPTNHLDIESREALEAALEDFDGTLVFVSHDRAFLAALSTRVWSFPEAEGGPIRDYPGGYEEWAEERAAGVVQPAAEAQPAAETGGARGAERRVGGAVEERAAAAQGGAGAGGEPHRGGGGEGGGGGGGAGGPGAVRGRRGCGASALADGGAGGGARGAGVALRAVGAAG